MDDFFKFYKDKCVKGSAISKHRFDKKRKCVKCELVTGGDWKRSPGGIMYYNTYVKQYEKAYINKMIMGILNLMTNDNMERLSDKLFKMMIKEVKTPTHLQEAIARIFDKILEDEDFVDTYADLCCKLSNIAVLETQNLKSNSRIKKYLFKYEMIKKIEKENTKYIYEAYKCSGNLNKKKMLNNISFIGELFFRNMIHNRIIYRHIYEILTMLENKPNNDVIELLCKFITVCGKKIDVVIISEIMDNFIIRLNEIGNNSKTTRIKYLIMDVVDLRRKKWKHKH